MKLLPAGLPNITGRFGATYGDSPKSSGVFQKSTTAQNGIGLDSGDDNTFYQNFSAGNYNGIYGNAETVQPPAIMLLPQIKY